MKERNLFLISFSTFSSLVLFLFTVSPRDRNIAYVFVPVVLFWISLSFGMLFVSKKLLKTRSLFSKSLIFSMSSITVLLLLMSGIGQLSFGDILLSTSLGVIVVFYFYRTWA